MTKTFSGACHCGSLRADFSTDFDCSSMKPRACDCSFCRKHGVVSVSDPQGQLVITASGPDPSRYRFGLGITDFLLCAVCGVYVAAVSTIEGDLRAVLNARILDRFDEFGPATPMSYDGETAEDRSARRAARWTPARMTRSGDIAASAAMKA